MISNFIASADSLPKTFSAHYWQSDQWEKTKSDSGCETFWATHKNAKALIIVRKAHFLKFWVQPFWEIPRGPIGDPADIPKLIENILAKAKAQNITCVRIYPPFGTRNFWKNLNFDTSVYSTKIAPEIFPLDTLMIDLTKSEEDILAQMKQKGRYNIKVAKKKGITVSQETNTNTFWKLMKQTTTRDGFRSVKKNVYQKMLNSFGENGILLTAKDETGEALASAIFTIGEGLAVYNYGASSNHKRNLMAPYLLQWEGMQWAKEKGAQTYDFLGISPENDESHKLSTVAGFKHKFGGQRVTCDNGLDFYIS